LLVAQTGCDANRLALSYTCLQLIWSNHSNLPSPDGQPRHVVPPSFHHCYIVPPPIPISIFCGLGWDHLQKSLFFLPSLEKFPNSQKKFEI
jgi:hypothetical protein